MTCVIQGRETVPALRAAYAEVGGGFVGRRLVDLLGIARAVLIGVFAVVGVYCAVRCAVGPPHGPGHGEHGRAADLAQVASSAAMIAMLVAGFTGDRWGIQLTVFAFGAVWFLVRALPVARQVAGVGQLHHAVMMAAMFWMSYTMSPAELSPGEVGMPAMAVVHRSSLGPGAVTTLAFVGLLAGGAVWWAGRSRALVAVAGGGTAQIATRGVFGARGVAICHAVAAAAMSATLVLVPPW